MYEFYSVAFVARGDIGHHPTGKLKMEGVGGEEWIEITSFLAKVDDKLLPNANTNLTSESVY